MNKRIRSGTIIVSLVVSACSLAPSYQRPPMEIPGGWSSVAGVGATAEPDRQSFWEELGSDELNRLMKVALAQNLDLEAALQRIDEARAQAKIAGSTLYPAVQATGGTSHTSQDPRDITTARATGSISYEVDLWGKNRNTAAA
ncbi:MAG: TolC family protein, partial [Deltaproteobacteria bacterium]